MILTTDRVLLTAVRTGVGLLLLSLWLSLGCQEAPRRPQPIDRGRPVAPRERPRTADSPPSPSKTRADRDRELRSADNGGATSIAEVGGEEATGNVVGPRAGSDQDFTSGGSAPLAQSVASYLRRLQSRDQGVAMEAFRQLWEVERELIPELLQQVEDRRLTSITKLTVITFNSITQVDETESKWVYYVPGLGGVKFDKIASGVIEGRKAYKVVLDRDSGFSVGEVVRAALLNRFRQPGYPPSIDDAVQTRAWWYRYYRNVEARL